MPRLQLSSQSTHKASAPNSHCFHQDPSKQTQPSTKLLHQSWQIQSQLHPNDNNLQNHHPPKISNKPQKYPTKKTYDKTPYKPHCNSNMPCPAPLRKLSFPSSTIYTLFHNAHTPNPSYICPHYVVPTKISPMLCFPSRL